MKIKKVLNNNAVIALNEQSEEVVITGLGLAFKKKAGDLLDQSKVERIFKMDSKEVSNRLTELIKEIPIKYVDVTEEIVTYAKGVLGKRLNENIYITLTDHICFAVKRIEDGLDVKNPLRWEIKQFYKKEYSVGIQALEIVNKRLGIALPEDEAASIAIHLVNAIMDEDMPQVVKMIKILQDSLNIIKYHFSVEFADDLLSYQRLVTHLKFFAQRIIRGEALPDDNESLYNLVKDQYPDSYKCADKIRTYAYEEHGFVVSNSEMSFLTVHIERVISQHEK